jgi:WD40 repeat protein
MLASVSAMIPLERKELFSPMCLALAPDKKTLALGGVVTTIPTPDPAKFGTIKQEGAFVLWDLTAEGVKKVFKGESSMVTTLAFSPDGRTLASAAFDRAVKLWDTTTYQRRAILKGQATPIFALAFSADGTHLVAGTLDGLVKRWDLQNIQTPVTFKGHQNSISSVCLSADGQTVLAGGVDGTIRSWDARKPAPHQFGTNVLDLAFTPDGKHLAGIDRDGILKRIDLGSGKEQQFKVPMPGQLPPFAVFAPDARTVAVIDRAQNPVRIVDALSGQERRQMKVNLLLSAAALSPDGNTLALGCSDRKVVWQIQLWNTHTAKLERTIQGGSGLVKCLAFSPDGKTLASGGTDRTVRTWNPKTGQVRKTTPGTAPASRLVFAPDGKRLAVAEAGSVRLLEAATGKEVLVLPGSLTVLSMSFSPDGRRLATGGGDGDLGRGFGVKLWDLATGRETLRLAGPTQVVSQVVFSPDGHRLATALGGDISTGPIYRIARPTEVKIWNAAP